MKAWIEPAILTSGADSYIRFSRINVNVTASPSSPGDTISLTVGGVSCAIFAWRDGKIIAQSPVLTPGQYYQFTALGEGWATFEPQAPAGIARVPAYVYLSLTGKPNLGAQKIPVGTINFRAENDGWSWTTPGYPGNYLPAGGFSDVDYPGHPVESSLPGARIKPRAPSAPMPARDKKKMWQRALTHSGHSSYFSARRWQQTRGGYIGCWPRQNYFIYDMPFLINGTATDGPFGVGRIGSPVSAVLVPGTTNDIDVLEVCGRVARLAADGNVTTRFGWRLKANTNVPILSHEDRNDPAFLQQFYDHVGSIADGDPHLSMADPSWQIADRAGFPTLRYIADSDRVVVYDDAQPSPVGRTLLGSTTHQEGYKDGAALQALFRKIRGIQWSPDGKTLYIADDHGCALRSYDPLTDTVGTVWRAANPDANNALTCVPGNPYGKSNGERIYADATRQQYFDFIRARMKEGSLDDPATNAMHFQQLQFDSQGRLITVMHHPHIVTAIDLAARTMKFIATIPWSTASMDSWVVLDIDRAGLFGVKDAIAVGFWGQLTDIEYSPSGAFLGCWTGYDNYIGADGLIHGGHGGNANQVTGRVADCAAEEYPTFILYTDRARYVGGWAGEGVREQTPMQADDPVFDGRWHNGFAQWTGGALTLMYAHGGIRAMDCLGGKSFYDLIGLSDAEVKAWLASIGYTKTGQPLDDLVYFLRWEGSLIDTSAVVQPPAPTPDPTPTPMPTTPYIEKVPNSVWPTVLADLHEVARFELHGSGGYQYKGPLDSVAAASVQPALHGFGDLYAVHGDASMGSLLTFCNVWNGAFYGEHPGWTRVYPHDLTRAVNGALIESGHSGYIMQDGKHHAVTETKNRWLAEQMLPTYPVIEPDHYYAHGQSMGAWAMLSWGWYQTDLFTHATADKPRFRGRTVWDYVKGTDFAPPAGLRTVSATGEMDFAARYDAVAHANDPAVKVLPLLFVLGLNDNFGSSADTLAFVNAMVLRKRWFACKVNIGDHSNAPVLADLTRTYPPAFFKRGRGLPLFTNCSRNFIDVARGIEINVGLTARNIVEDASSFSCEVTCVDGPATFDVEPLSPVFTTAVAPQTVSIKTVVVTDPVTKVTTTTLDWQKVTFSKVAAPPPPPAPPPLPPPLTLDERVAALEVAARAAGWVV